jgi:RND family efflux transporter MFP subunit
MKTPSLLAITLAFLAITFTRAEDEEPPATEVAVHVGKVIRTTLHRAVTVYGGVEPEPAEAGQPPASARLSPALAGIISEANGSEGQRVEKGTVLFRLDSRAVDAAVAKAELGIDFARKNAERQKKLIAAEGTSEKQVLEAEQALAAAQTELATAKVQQSLLLGEAPLSGTLTRFTARPGEAADATTILAEIVDLDRLVAVVKVPRAEAADLKPGQKATLKAVHQETPIEGSVAFISSQVDAVQDTVAVRVALPKGTGLLPGDFVNARIIVEEHADKLAVPVASVFTDGEGRTTLSLVEGDTATQHEVTVGLRDGGLVEVEGEGVDEGSIVVTTGSYALPEETKVRILNADAEAPAE